MEMVLCRLLNIIQIALFLLGCYYLGIAAFSLKIVKRERISDREHTYALIVAAHNEESVIAQLVSSLNELEYNKEKYKVFVVADNCTDKTAENARNAGAVVLERFNTVKKGKGFALEYAFEHIFSLEESYEYICVFDADNIVKSDFLLHMNNKINEGYRAVQGYLDSKNPTDTWLTFAYSMWYWIYNRVSQLSRGNLDMGCRLGGTGFAVESELIREYGWGATCLAEDTEFTLKLALSGIKVGWEHSAVVYDEKPQSLGTSMKQRRRWMQGLSDVASRYIEPLIRKGISEKKAMPINMVLNFWGDSLYCIAAGFFSVVYAALLLSQKGRGILEPVLDMWRTPENMLVLSLFVWGNIFVALAGLYNDRRLDKNIIKNCLGFILYIVTWVPIAVMGIFGKDSEEWFHTPHSPKRNQ